MSGRFLRRTLLIALSLLLIVGMLGAAALVLTPQGRSVRARISEKQDAGILEQTARLTLRRLVAKFERSGSVSDLSVEDVRADLPETKIVAAIPAADRTPATRVDASQTPASWHHSFGDAASRKYADISWMDPDKVQSMERLWTYETPGAKGNIQATPVYTGRLLIFPTARDRIVALDPGTGETVWEFDPELRQPARRGLVFVPDPEGKPGAGEIYFAAKGKLFAANAVTGRPNPDFGDTGAISVGYRKLKDHEGYPGSRPPWGTLTAIDLASGRHVWRVPLGRYDDLIARGLSPTGTENMAGPTVTSGGVIFVSGTKDRLIRAFNSRTGAEVWEAELPFIGSASPMVFEHDGAGYVVVPATGGGTLAIYDPDVQTGSSFVAFRVTR